MSTAITATLKTVRTIPLILAILVLLPGKLIEVIENYFFGGAACWSDRFWFYGFFAFGFGALGFCYYISSLPY